MFHLELKDGSVVFKCKRINTQQTCGNQRWISRFSIALKKLFSGLEYSSMHNVHFLWQPYPLKSTIRALQLLKQSINISKIPPDLPFDARCLRQYSQSDVRASTSSSPAPQHIPSRNVTSISSSVSVGPVSVTVNRDLYTYCVNQTSR